ncbi:PHP domain-containing protein [Candidatus Gottesmanbacteria bacterium]|nr:PHP domain-containing protein [Candidatus Gottesmanbacteria bacterium]
MSNVELDYADFHIHSRVSKDGESSIWDIVNRGVGEGLKYLGLSDHNSIEGLTAFIDAISRMQNQGIIIFPIAGCEFTAVGRNENMGHLLAGKAIDSSVSDDVKKEWLRFLAREVEAIKGDGKFPQLMDLIKKISDHGGFAVVTHPMFWGIKSFGDETIRSLSDTVDDNLRRVIALEARNFLTQIQPAPINLRREEKVRQFADLYGFAVTGGSDAHNARDIGRVRTTLPQGVLFQRAFEGREVRPMIMSPMGWVERMGHVRKFGGHIFQRGLD